MNIPDQLGAAFRRFKSNEPSRTLHEMSTLAFNPGSRMMKNVPEHLPGQRQDRVQRAAILRP
jgi:hypothetical protein